MLKTCPTGCLPSHKFLWWKVCHFTANIPSQAINLWKLNYTIINETTNQPNNNNYFNIFPHRFTPEFINKCVKFSFHNYINSNIRIVKQYLFSMPPQQTKTQKKKLFLINTKLVKHSADMLRYNCGVAC